MVSDTRRRKRFGALLGSALLVACGAAGADDSDWRDTLRGGTAAEQTALGLRYVHAEGVVRDVDTGVRLLCAAARSGHGPAQYELGWLYANGRGVARDDALAAAWFELAADGGDAHARRMLGFLGAPVEAKPALCVSPAGRHPYLVGEAPPRAAVERAVQYLAPAFGLDAALVLAVIEAESGFDARARSPKGALGLMQLIPATAARFGVSDPLDPDQNLRGGMSYLRWLLTHFDGDVRLALAGYNAGEEAVARFGGIPPYAETRAYVERVTQRYSQPYHPLKEVMLYAAADPARAPSPN